MKKIVISLLLVVLLTGGCFSGSVQDKEWENKLEIEIEKVNLEWEKKLEEQREKTEKERFDILERCTFRANMVYHTETEEECKKRYNTNLCQLPMELINDLSRKLDSEIDRCNSLWDDEYIYEIKDFESFTDTIEKEN